MARIRIELPGHFPFHTELPVRITDLNYGGHVGNDNILSLLHEARVQFLRHNGYSELSIGGVALIMSDVAIEFKRQAVYGDILRASVAAGEFGRAGFELYYKLEIEAGDKWTLVATAKTGLVCYDYSTNKVMPMPEAVRAKLLGA